MCTTRLRLNRGVLGRVGGSVCASPLPHPGPGTGARRGGARILHRWGQAGREGAGVSPPAPAGIGRAPPAPPALPSAAAAAHSRRPRRPRRQLACSRGLQRGEGSAGSAFIPPPPPLLRPPSSTSASLPAPPSPPASTAARRAARSVACQLRRRGGGKQGDAFAAVFPPPALSVPGGAVMWSRECRAKPSPGRSDRHKPLAGALAAAHCPGKPEQPLPAPGNPSSSPRWCPGLPRSKVSGGASLLPPAEGCGLGLF